MNAPLNLTATVNPFDIWFQPHEILDGKSMMDHLYNRLDGAYPHKWRSNFPSPEAIDNWSTSWAEAFEDEGVKPTDIKVGLRACRTKYDWPPSCSEFIKACKPAVDSMVAYYEAVAGVQARGLGKPGVWSHPAIYWASVPLSFDLGSLPFTQIKTRWERALAEQMDKGEWELIPEPMLALADIGKTVLSKEKAEKLMREFKASDVVKKASDKTDHLRWAKNILRREKEKDKTLSVLQIRFARDALGAKA